MKNENFTPTPLVYSVCTYTYIHTIHQVWGRIIYTINTLSYTMSQHIVSKIHYLYTKIHQRFGGKLQYKIDKFLKKLSKEGQIFAVRPNVWRQNG